MKTSTKIVIVVAVLIVWSVSATRLHGTVLLGDLLAEACLVIGLVALLYKQHHERGK